MKTKPKLSENARLAIKVLRRAKKQMDSRERIVKDCGDFIDHKGHARTVRGMVEIATPACIKAGCAGCVIAGIAFALVGIKGTDRIKRALYAKVEDAIPLINPSYNEWHFRRTPQFFSKVYDKAIELVKTQGLWA